MKYFLLLIFLLSCAETRKEKQAESNVPSINRFRQIDGKLKSLSRKLNANMFTSGPGYQVNGISVPPDSIKERRIIWIDGQIGKAIFIVPDFEKVILAL